MLEIAAAATIPFLSAFTFSRMVRATGGLGVLITILEGMLHLNQYQQNWIAYRSTGAEGLFNIPRSRYATASVDHSRLVGAGSRTFSESHYVSDRNGLVSCIDSKLVREVSLAARFAVPNQHCSDRLLEF
jgi:hypothetical protein